ncbi:MAG TPA: coproporphyrinogen III oxidase, partial [Pseudorhodoplanes sp.]|nr:coproporphyrinogen III oxidase [Pseudorhodoplanes sp.]
RNFQGYTTDQADALIGLGASAIGKLPQGFVQNATDTAGYSRAIGAGQFATARGLALSGDDCMRADIIERLMCDLSVDLDAVVGECGAPVRETFASELSALQPLAAEGVVQIDGSRVMVTEQGRPFVRLVAAAFDAYLPRGQARHSIAI